MIRSREVMRSKAPSPVMAEHESGPSPELHHLRVTPHNTGVTVTHHASPRAEAHATHNFNHGESEAFMEHLDQHSGMAGAAGEPEAHSSVATGGLEEE